MFVQLGRALILSLLCVGPSAYAILDRVSYSATRVMRIDGTEIITTVNHAPHMERISGTIGGLPLTLILRSDRNVVWQLIPFMSMYGEADITEMDTPDNVQILSREEVGNEIINGHAAIKYRAEFLTRGGTRHHGFFWENADGVHVRSEFPFIGRDGTEKRVELELRDVQVGPTGDRLVRSRPRLHPDRCRPGEPVADLSGVLLPGGVFHPPTLVGFDEHAVAVAGPVALQIAPQ
ncbi:MAG: hypothetical protein HC809_07940 [Gammaproteobacteria bacterium]|nr:hypothetical protein [Gammaproteobacteria bacterium]